MKTAKIQRSSNERWAEFRLSVVGALLSSPPERGALASSLRSLASKTWQHPLNDSIVTYDISTIERWYYLLKNSKDYPLNSLKRKPRVDQNKTRKIDAYVSTLIKEQYQLHKRWSYQLHVDNIASLLKAKGKSELMPSYSTVLRYMQAEGLEKKKIPKRGRVLSEEKWESKEIRSFEAEYVNSLWHLDFHHCSRGIITEAGKRVSPICLAIMDDCSRVVCHIQWYLHETTENLVHGFSQALYKRGLPRELMSDNGSAMTSEEFSQGLLQLGILEKHTLPYSPYQNGKQERFFGILEGRLMAMLEGYENLSLELLNKATMAWVDMEYNRKENMEMKDSPNNRYYKIKDVSRVCNLSSEKLKFLFRRKEKRIQRKKDGTISLQGVRFEIPYQYHQIRELYIRYATWDLSCVHLVDHKTDEILSVLYPLDKTKNAEGIRKAKTIDSSPEVELRTDEIAPLLQECMDEFAKTGSPCLYIPKSET